MTEKTATLIGNIFVNNPSFKYLSGSITTSISDQLPQIIIVENFKGKSVTTEIINTNCRDCKYFHTDLFIRDMQELCWNVATKNDINLGFETFLRLFCSTVDRHASIKKSTRKEVKNKSIIIR